MSDITKVYYIASVLCKQVKAYSGKIIINNNYKAWLGFDVDDVYTQCVEKFYAHKFKTSKEIPDKVKNWDGMPWYFQLKEGTLEIIKVTERTLHEIKEEIVNERS